MIDEAEFSLHEKWKPDNDGMYLCILKEQNGHLFYKTLERFMGCWVMDDYEGYEEDELPDVVAWSFLTPVEEVYKKLTK